MASTFESINSIVSQNQAGADGREHAERSDWGIYFRADPPPGPEIPKLFLYLPVCCLLLVLVLVVLVVGFLLLACCVCTTHYVRS